MADFSSKCGAVCVSGLKDNVVEKSKRDWRAFSALLGQPEFQDLNVDCVAVGRSVTRSHSVQVQEVLFVQGELHENPVILRSHCASLVAVWGAMREPSVLDLGDCTCVGRRILLGEPKSGRRFAIHALPLCTESSIFTVLSSTSRWAGSTAQIMVGKLASRASHTYRQLQDRPQSDDVPQTPRAFDWYVFTQREVDILKLLSKGMSNKQIARELGSSPNTVRNQVHSVFRKAGVANRTELALRANVATES